MAARRLSAALRRGFTTIRDPAGGDPAFARAGREGLFLSPRYLYTGAPMSQTGGHGDPRQPESTACVHDASIVDGVDDLRRQTRERFRQGAHVADHDAFLVPTLIAYDAMSRRAADLGLPPVSMRKNDEVLGSGRQAIALARDAGVRIGFGSDLMGELEDEQLGGLRLQADVLGVIETVRCATSTNADLIQRSDLGRLVPGAVGDLLILDADLTEDPAALWEEDHRPRTVVRSGQIMVAP